MSERPRILLVEDYEDILFVMRAELEWMGYQVDAARNGAVALKVAAVTPPDLIISDVCMPDIDGLEFIRMVRENPTLASVPAIAVTGLSTEREIKEVLDHGFTDYLVKPVEPGEL